MVVPPPPTSTAPTQQKSVAELIASSPVGDDGPLLPCYAYITDVSLPSIGTVGEQPMIITISDQPAFAADLRSGSGETQVSVPADAVPMLLCGLQMDSIRSSRTALEVARCVARALIGGNDRPTASRVCLFLADLRTTDSQGYCLPIGGPRFALRNVIVTMPIDLTSGC